MAYLLILGATSDIAISSAHFFAEKGFNLYLTARKTEDLKKAKTDLEIRYNNQIQVYSLDALNFTTHKDFYQNLPEKPVGVLCAIGYLGDNEKAKADFGEMQKIMETNYTGVVSILSIIAADFQERQKGFIIGISSVAGDRGRSTNYAYGAAKAALTTYLSGLRGWLYRYNVSVITIKPGFVRTKMTENMDLPKLLVATKEQAGRDIYNAWEKNKEVIYTRWFWRYIMLIIKGLPEKLFKKITF